MFLPRLVPFQLYLHLLYLCINVSELWMSHRQEDRAFETTASWISNTASAVGEVIKTRRNSGDEQQPLLGVDEEMGLVSSFDQPSSRGQRPGLSTGCAQQ